MASISAAELANLIGLAFVLCLVISSIAKDSTWNLNDTFKTSEIKAAEAFSIIALILFAISLGLSLLLLRAFSHRRTLFTSIGSACTGLGFLSTVISVALIYNMFPIEVHYGALMLSATTTSALLCLYQILHVLRF